MYFVYKINAEFLNLFILKGTISVISYDGNVRFTMVCLKVLSDGECLTNE